MPYIFFFKIKNCLNYDLYISCDDRTGKCCITSAYLQLLDHSGERPVARGPLVYESGADPGRFLKGFDLIEFPFLHYVFGQTCLSKQCRPRSGATERI